LSGYFPVLVGSNAISKVVALDYAVTGLNSKIAYPSSQFWWLRLLAGLIHIAKRRGSKETAVFAAEL
jgi:hypothetical protein